MDSTIKYGKITFLGYLTDDMHATRAYHTSTIAEFGDSVWRNNIEEDNIQK